MRQQREKQLQIELLRSLRPVFTLWLILVALSAFSVRGLSLNVYGITQPNSATFTAIVLTVLVVVHGGCGWLMPAFMKYRFGQVGLLILQIVVALIAGSLIGFGQGMLYIGIVPIMLLEAANLFHHVWIAIGSLIGFYVFIWIGILLHTSFRESLPLGATGLFVTFIVVYYWFFFRKQIQQRQHAEELLAELNIAYQQVEDSATRAERRRVAQDLHDTLIQGLAGTVMQLEAAQQFMKQDQADKAQATVDRSLTIARQTLKESRTTLTNLRDDSETDLAARLGLLINALQSKYGFEVTTSIKASPVLPAETLTQIVRCVSECLMNVYKHAGVMSAIVKGQPVGDHHYQLQVVDFGKGFKLSQTKRSQDHYGLTELEERLARVGGTVAIDTVIGEGTTVTLDVVTTK